MSVYKDAEKNTWYCKFYYKTWDGNKKQTTKRGFKTKREAQQWEAEFKTSNSSNINVQMKTFVEMYFADKKNELKERSIKNKRYLMERHVLPYFGEKKMTEIKASDIIQWQNLMREKGYSQTYLRMVQNQLTALFTHATNIYGLGDNPCKRVKKMGKSDADELSFWTKEEYDNFISTFEADDRYFVLFELLFWTGCRIGEALALTSEDILLDKNQINICKTYYRTGGEDVITTPKTEQSVRMVDIPEFLKQEIKQYLDRLYKYPRDERIFPVAAEAVQHMMKKHIEMAGVKKIRVHDLRHSHIAYLIHQGVEPLMIKQRVGHKDIKITLNTYGHLYPNQQKKLAEMLNERRVSSIINADS